MSTWSEADPILHEERTSEKGQDEAVEVVDAAG